MSSAEDFFKSEVIAEELDELQVCYTDLLKMSQNFQTLDPDGQLEHIEKTLELIAKQKVFYARLNLMQSQLDLEEDPDQEIKEIKDRIDSCSSVYSGGQNLMAVLDAMEQKLQTWRRGLLDNA
tara:strand:- start:300 stop:668 length:369 start_codon:yes stop_codon:yes gene_type:complete